MSYIKLDRKMLDWGWYTDVPVMKLWTHILLKANWSSSTFVGIEIPRGSLITSTSRLAIETGLTEKQVRGALMKLEKTHEIATEKTNKYTLICVQKWDEYQGQMCDEGQTEGKQQGTPEGKPQGTQRATSKEINNIRKQEIKEIHKEKFVKPSVEEIRNYCTELKHYIDAEYFFNYYESNGWKVGKNPMKDWKATVRNWIRKENPKPQQEERKVEQLWY